MTARMASVAGYSSNTTLYTRTPFISFIKKRNLMMNSELNYEWKQLEAEIWVCLRIFQLQKSKL